MNDKLSGGKVGLGEEGQQWPCDDMGASVPSITGEGRGYSGQAKCTSFSVRVRVTEHQKGSQSG